ncbi:MAG: tRNA uridine-5-carboxymethylaminomethyl(34) synthesis GTPase MnmE [Ruminococcaceae bacterium]|nr:tRNA uridine-5-carboxymethylaminomethyl(34) synthesis GTPase MnmE [Oscillospiraceae bacterium]
MNQLDTIAAISTPYGKGGIAVLRVSGEDAIKVASRVFEAKSGKALGDIASSRAVYGYILENSNGKRVQIDDGLAVCFRAPNSFTGEDTVEISCHGGVLVTQKVLSALLMAGARMAMPGEFTKRSFINGKMSLTSAEALGDLLEAQTDEQIMLARSGMKGVLSGAVGEIYNSLCDVLAAIYAHIDYPDEDLADISHEEALTVAKDNLIRLKRLSKTYSTGRAVMGGIPTVILGRTNAGKSSLYNRIVGRDAAIVTDIEGTTRDVLTETAKLGRVILRLSDTAGLRESGDVVEKIGIDRARQAAESAELVLAVFDGSRVPDDNDAEFVEYLQTIGGVKVAVVNKSDLGILPEVNGLLSNFEYICQVSAESGDGFDKLALLIEQLYIDNDLDTGRDAIISNARQAASVSSAIEALEIAVNAISAELPLEICCAEIENTLSALGELDGRTVSEDIVSRIFANFCVGK